MSRIGKQNAGMGSDCGLSTVVDEFCGIEQLEAKQLLMKLSCDDFLKSYDL
jgi:hypothetical protein